MKKSDEPSAGKKRPDITGQVKSSQVKSSQGRAGQGRAGHDYPEKKFPD